MPVRQQLQGQGHRTPFRSPEGGRLGTQAQVHALAGFRDFRRLGQGRGMGPKGLLQVLELAGAVFFSKLPDQDQALHGLKVSLGGQGSGAVSAPLADDPGGTKALGVAGQLPFQSQSPPQLIGVVKSHHNTHDLHELAKGFGGSGRVSKRKTFPRVKALNPGLLAKGQPV